MLDNIFSLQQIILTIDFQSGCTLLQSQNLPHLLHINSALGSKVYFYARQGEENLNKAPALQLLKQKKKQAVSD